jgi:2,4-dienoyl-CoA reductase (NADPH2)
MITPSPISLKSSIAKEQEKLPADLVVIASGLRPVDELPQEVKQMGVQVMTIGDAKAPRKIIDAVTEGFDAAMTI